MIMFRGATAYENQVGRIWLRLPYPRFLAAGCRPTAGWDRTAD